MGWPGEWRAVAGATEGVSLENVRSFDAMRRGLESWLGNTSNLRIGKGIYWALAWDLDLMFSVGAGWLFCTMNIPSYLIDGIDGRNRPSRDSG